MIRLVLCADDFGRSPSINDAILRLAGSGVLTAVTAMVGEQHVREAAPDLMSIEGCEIGLHLTLTDGMAPDADPALAPGGVLPPCDRLAAMTLAGTAPLGAIGREIDRQFAAFADIFGRPPAFVDGHQHVHVLPGIRQYVLNATHIHNPHAWVRTCEDSLMTMVRRGGDRIRALRSAWLSRGLRQQAAAVGLRTNDGFSGLYDLRDKRPFAPRFERFLDQARGPNHLVICHPAVTQDAGDPIARARVSEYRFLASQPIVGMARRRNLQLGCFQ